MAAAERVLHGPGFERAHVRPRQLPFAGGGEHELDIAGLRPALAARPRVLADEADLAARAAADGINGALEPWDWRYYAAHRRRDSLAVDEAEVKRVVASAGRVRATACVAAVKGTSEPSAVRTTAWGTGAGR